MYAHRLQSSTNSDCSVHVSLLGRASIVPSDMTQARNMHACMHDVFSFHSMSTLFHPHSCLPHLDSALKAVLEGTGKITTLLQLSLYSGCSGDRFFCVTLISSPGTLITKKGRSKSKGGFCSWVLHEKRSLSTSNYFSIHVCLLYWFLIKCGILDKCFVILNLNFLQVLWQAITSFWKNATGSN